jgi:glycosyltransferase involved in cell wall biosynthesis
VIIPAYNAGFFIETAIASCLSQVYSPLEIVVVDDCSTDDTARRVRRFPSVTLIGLPSNVGTAEALNVGIQSAKGGFVCWLSADDAFVDSTKVAKQAEEMERTNADLSYYSSYFVGTNMKKAKLFKPSLSSLMRFPKLRLFAVLVHNPINGSSVMLRRTSIGKYGEFDSSLRNVVADGDLWMRWLSGGARLAIIEGPGVFRRVHAKQTSSRFLMTRKGQLLTRARFLSKWLLGRKET